MKIQLETMIDGDMEVLMLMTAINESLARMYGEELWEAWELSALTSFRDQLDRHIN